MRTLVVKCAVGIDDDRERCLQALTVAATAVSSGVPTSLWLAGEAVWLAVPGRAPEGDETPSASDLLQAVREAGTLTVCSRCAARRGLTGGDLVPGVRIAGASTFLEEALAPDAQALVY